MKHLITIFILFWAVQCTAQNLIPNPSFVDTAKILKGFDWPAGREMAAGLNTGPEFYNEFQDTLWTILQDFSELNLLKMKQFI